MFESRFDLLSFQILFSIASHQIDIQISERNSRNRISTSQNIPKQNYNIENLNPTMDFNFQPEHEHAQHQITLQLKKKKRKENMFLPTLFEPSLIRHFYLVAKANDKGTQ